MGVGGPWPTHHIPHPKALFHEVMHPPWLIGAGRVSMPQLAVFA